MYIYIIIHKITLKSDYYFLKSQNCRRKKENNEKSWTKKIMVLSIKLQLGTVQIPALIFLCVVYMFLQNTCFMG